ncbi:sterol desaturase family protein [Chroococcidiopsis cubana CCALA 043]|nr:sterol desaturase family protein [Chroococcidiopsis cubana]PSB52896.1 sterol desaturase family protein [Chroococcidiopsis cubana CCALA 043]
MPNFCLTLPKLWFCWSGFFGMILLRYFLIAGGAYWFFYSVVGKPLMRERWRHKAMLHSIGQDIKLSVLSAVVFALGAASIMLGYESGATLLYVSLHEYGLWYVGVSFVAVLLLQDAYFYFVHRAFHHPKLFKWLHHGHHRSRQPTPWTSFAFDLPEALVHALFLVGVVFLIPLHLITLVAVLMTMTIWATITHLGFKLFDTSFLGQWLGQWLIGPTHHSLHHRQYRLHYGLYFTFWDKLLGTQAADY